MEGFVHMLGEGVVEAGVVGSDQDYERALKVFEWAMELQKQKREDLRDLLELRTGRMDMYQLVCALLLGLCMTMFVENPLLDHLQEMDGTTGNHLWILQPFLVSNISAIGCLFISLWLSVHASTAAHADGVTKLLQYMRVELPTPAQLTSIRKRFRLPARLNPMRNESTPYDGSAGAAPAQAPLLRAPAALQDVEAHAPPSPWDADEHVRAFLQGQQREALMDAYTRVTMIAGVNQLLQALSYYLIGAVAKGSLTGAFVCAIGIQGLAVLLLRLDVDDVRCLDILWVTLAHMLPPLLAGTVLVLENHGAPQWVTIIATLSFALHVLWICHLLREIAPTVDTKGRWKAPQRFQAVCRILDTDEVAPGAQPPRPLSWLVTRRLFVMIAVMWVVSIAMNLAWVLWQFD